MNRKTIIRPHIAPIEEGTTLTIWYDHGLYLFDIETWGVAPNGNALLLEEHKDRSLLDIINIPLTMQKIETMEYNDVTGEITIYHQ